jgi:adenylate kinase family enzyme
MVRNYNESSSQLTPLLEKSTKLVQIRTDQQVEKTMKEIYSHIEPIVVHIRPGAQTPNKLGEEIVAKLSKEHGFVNLDVNKCIDGEFARRTNFGVELEKYIRASKIIPANMVVEMLRKIIYCGQPKLNKFILSNFPEVIDQAEEFEKNCAQIAAVIYPTPTGSTVELKNNAIQVYNIDTMFQKDFKLKTMSEWNYRLFQDKLG